MCVESLIILIRSGFFKDKLIDLRNGIFIFKEFWVIIKIVLYFEKGGRNLCWLLVKESLSIFMFGMCFVYGDIGWWVLYMYIYI